MRYIRTKDCRIIDTEKEYSKHPANYPIQARDYGLIVKQADTIEELCDEAVFFDNDNVPHYKSKEGEVWYLGASLFSESLRFGIWTPKGLLYVAKMNDKGGVELI